jgi:putative transposase
MKKRDNARFWGMAHSTLYYEPAGESKENLALMRRIDELYTENPTRGSRKLRDRLRLEGKGVKRNMKRTLSVPEK